VEIPCQTVKEGSTLNLDWRKRIVFEGKLKPMGITKFSVYVKQTPAQSKKAVPCTIEAYLPKLLREPISLEMREDTVDPWGMSNEELKGLGKNPKPFRLMSEQEAAAFCGVKEAISPVRKIEDGEVLTSVEAFYTADNTNAVIEYKLYKNQPYFDLKATIEYADKNKLIRLKVPTPQGVVVGDGPYIVEEKPTNAEICFQKWFGVKTDNGEIFSIINNCTYAGKAEDGYLALDLVRGAGYCVHPIGERPLYPQDRYLPRIEGGRYEFNLRIYQASVDKVCAEAELYNQAPYAINVFPTGGDKKSATLYVDKAVSMPVCKIGDDGYVMRFFNPSATTQEFTFTIADKTKTVTLAPYEIVSVKYADEISVSHETILT
jgi:alpha-mannosidase